ncbi:hypothetical protein CARUB_v10011181mg [Capsella rubella]|uniref:Glycine-rich protein n=1 Tax=Capsella rubella TaxID=81985 RepID=R0IK13_9BRAS|nr:uncharacterized protein LOC17899800 [Capsella rubella]EOA38840.1 hypothetical protein CARUB_v10011181mg [Capsella rubella]
MGMKRTSLVLYILFVFLLVQRFHSVSSSRPTSVDKNHETLPLSEDDSKSEDVVGFEGKARELAVVIKRGGGGGGRGGGGSRGSKSRHVIPIHTGGGGSHHRSSGTRNLQGTAGWLALSVILAGLILVQ